MFIKLKNKQLMDEFFRFYVIKSDDSQKVLKKLHHFYYLNSFLRLIIGRNFEKYITRKLFENSTNEVTLNNGLDIQFFLPGFGIFFEIITKDIYEIWDLPKNPVVVDAGANIGLFSLCVAKNYPKTESYAFEPNSKNYKLLVRNITKNGFNIKPIKKGLYSKKEVKKLYLKGTGTHTLVKSSMYKNYEEVTLTTLDDELKNVKRIDMLKIDVEGVALEVIKGGLKTLDKTSKIIMEFDVNQSLEELYDILYSKGFKVRQERGMVYGKKT
jgi:FkbM family methyltransferase